MLTSTTTITAGPPRLSALDKIMAAKAALVEAFQRRVQRHNSRRLRGRAWSLRFAARFGDTRNTRSIRPTIASLMQPAEFPHDKARSASSYRCVRREAAKVEYRHAHAA